MMLNWDLSAWKYIHHEQQAHRNSYKKDPEAEKNYIQGKNAKGELSLKKWDDE